MTHYVTGKWNIGRHIILNLKWPSNLLLLLCDELNLQYCEFVLVSSGPDAVTNCRVLVHGESIGLIIKCSTFNVCDGLFVVNRLRELRAGISRCWMGPISRRNAMPTTYVQNAIPPGVDLHCVSFDLLYLICVLDPFLKYRSVSSPRYQHYRVGIRICTWSYFIWRFAHVFNNPLLFIVQ